MGTNEAPKGEKSRDRLKQLPSIFKDDFSFLKAGIEFFKTREPLQVYFDDAYQRIEITLNQELRQRFRDLPKEIMLADHVFVLSADKNVIDAEIRKARKQENA